MYCTTLVPGHAGGVITFSVEAPLISNTILILRKLSIDSILAVSRLRPKAILIPDGLPFSHLAIHLASLGIPAASISATAIQENWEGTMAILNSSKCELILNPDEATLALPEENSYEVSDIVTHQASTLDGRSIVIGASIASLEGTRSALKYGADEIGLMRSEFLFTHSGPELEGTEYENVLRQVCGAFSSAPIRIRLFDLGGEKIFPWMPLVPDLERALGLRGARIYSHPLYAPIFDMQIQILATLARERELSILIPFITSAEEFIFFRRRIEAIAPAALFRIGCMLEVPSACLSIKDLALAADFLAVGTNDLLQCFFGADRSLSSVSSYVDPYSPTLWRFLALMSEMARESKTVVQICGRLSSFPLIAPLLIGLGFSSFSVEPLAVPTMKHLVSENSFEDLSILASRATLMRSAPELRQWLELELGTQTREETNHE